MAERKAKGRRKIPMKRIESEEDRLITFSKRRSGIYKKATEISTLCGAEVGILIFSPAGKPFAYGIPNIESVANRLMSRRSGDYYRGGVDLSNGGVMEAFRRAKLEDLNRSCDELSAHLQWLKKEGERLAEEGRGKLKEAGKEAACWWWDVPVEDLKADEMEQMTVTMEEMKKSAANRLRDLLGEANSSSIANEVNGIGMMALAMAPGNVFGFGY